MSTNTFVRPAPASHTEQINNAAARHEASVKALRDEVEKRFWALRLDPQLNWYYVEDQLGRRLCQPMILPSLRGWISQLPPQA